LRCALDLNKLIRSCWSTERSWRCSKFSVGKRIQQWFNTHHSPHLPRTHWSTQHFACSARSLMLGILLVP
jgi:hypothetical protein